MVEGGGSVIAAFFLAHNYVSEQFGNYVEYGIYYMVSVKAKIRTISSDVHQLQFIKLHHPFPWQTSLENVTMCVHIRRKSFMIG